MIARELTVDEISQVIEDAERIAADLEARAEAHEAAFLQVDEDGVPPLIVG